MLAATLAAALVLTSGAQSEREEPVNKETTMLEETLQDNATAIEAARKWIELVDAGDYGDSWTQAGSMFRQAVTADAWAAQVAPIREPLGALVSRTEKGIEMRSELPGAPAGEYAMIAFDTDFANASDRVETVVMAKDDGRWSVVGYFIR